MLNHGTVAVLAILVALGSIPAAAGPAELVPAAARAEATTPADLQRITVEVVEPMTSDWQILQSSIPHEKRDAQTAVFQVPVARDGEAVLTYRVRVRQ